MMNIYFTGGCGINVGKRVNVTNAKMAFIDTSDSNFKGIDSSKTFQVEGQDGAGKKRQLAHAGFAGQEQDVLIKHKPSDEINIVVSSLAGGSGSVIGPMLVSQLLGMNKNVIAIGVDSTQSMIEISNTIATLQTYRKISKDRNKAVSLFYVENKVRKEADDKVMWFINLINLIVDKNRTEEFDTADLSNFINFDRVTDNKPNVTFLEVNHNAAFVPNKNTSVVSTIHVSVDTTVQIEAPVPEYLATCIVTDPTAVEGLNARIDNVLGALYLQVTNLEALMLSHKENKIVNKVLDVSINDADSIDSVVF